MTVSCSSYDIVSQIGRTARLNIKDGFNPIEAIHLNVQACRLQTKPCVNAIRVRLYPLAGNLCRIAAITTNFKGKIAHIISG